MNATYRKIIEDNYTNLDELDFENNRYLIILERGTKGLIKGRKELKEFLKEYEAEVDTIIELTNKTDRFIDYEINNRYKVGVNILKDDYDYCEYVDDQYSELVLAPSVDEALKLAVNQTKSTYNDSDARYKPVWIERFDARKKEWKKVSFKWTE